MNAGVEKEVSIMLRAALVLILGILPLFGQVRADLAPSVGLPDHKVVPDDQLWIAVYDEPGLSRTVRVAKDGVIVLPVLKDPLHVEGLLPREIEAEITRELLDQQILVHPTVAVTITEYALRTVSVVGDVKTPGQFPITIPISLVEALAKAGWATSDAGPDLLLTRPDSQAAEKINILQLQADPALNVKLMGGETVSVPEAPKVWVTGNVTKPQAVPVKNPADATVYKILADVEGLAQYYGKTAYIYRLDPTATTTGGRREIPVPLRDMMHRKAPDVALIADDVLLIPDDNGAKRRAVLQTLQNMATTATSAAILYASR
jgi:polysaccharide export outer membrane protein